MPENPNGGYPSAKLHRKREGPNSGVRGRKGHQHKNALIKCFEMSLNLPHLRVNFKNPCKAIV